MTTTDTVARMTPKLPSRESKIFPPPLLDPSDEALAGVLVTFGDEPAVVGGG